MRASQRIATVLVGCLLLSGCITVGPDYEAPEAETPDTWHQVMIRGLQEGHADLQTWWTVFQDPLLDQLIERAFAGSLSLREAVARVEEARASYGIAAGERFPDIDAQGSAQRVRESSEIVSVVPPPTTRNDNFFAAGLDSTWELDLWGRIRRSVESAESSYEASLEDYRDVLVTLYADVGFTYVQVRALQDRIRYAEQNVRTQSGSLQLTADRNRAGLVGDLDVRQAELNLATTEAFIPTLRIALAEAIHRLSVLLGLEPHALVGELEAEAPIPVPPQQIVVGLPTELLRQRPDIRSAERRLAAQNAQIGVAKAALYPTFSLSGTFSVEAIRGNKLFDWNSRAYGIGPVFRWNVFDGGRIRSNVRAQDARTEQLLQRYEDTVLRALEEVENSMVAYVQESERRDALDRSVVAARQAVDLVNTLYRTGLTDFQNVLDTERSLFQQEDQLAESEGFVSQDLIQLYRSLGGGWGPGTGLPMASTSP
jgi:NodT family efflux transporter outer membrane factor (OMF) lipoprotein